MTPSQVASTGTGELLTIDGSSIGGGGQILRSALALSLILDRPIRMIRIRERRPKPGLARQHVECIAGVCRVGGLPIPRLLVGQREVEIVPTGAIWPGKHRLAVDGAGSTMLMLQTVYLPLALCEQQSTVELTGGTHVPMSPPFETLAMGLAALLNRAGLDLSVSLARAGFYPVGAGRVMAEIRPASLSQLVLPERGECLERRAIIVSCNLPDHVAAREKTTLEEQLGHGWSVEILSPPASSPGNAVVLLERFERGLLVHSSLGARGKPAESVAREAVSARNASLLTAATVDPHLADQLMLPLALASGESFYVAPRLTDHMRTHAWLLGLFLGQVVLFDERADGVEVRIRGVSSPRRASR